MGSGTTLWVAKNLFRSSIGYDISEEYCKMALERNQQQVFL
jgi:DNA modification methylase